MSQEQRQGVCFLSHTPLVEIHISRRTGGRSERQGSLVAINRLEPDLLDALPGVDRIEREWRDDDGLRVAMVLEYLPSTPSSFDRHPFQIMASGFPAPQT
jgi:hypothetical protein